MGFFWILFLKSYNSLCFSTREFGEFSFDSEFLIDFHNERNSISTKWDHFIEKDLIIGGSYYIKLSQYYYFASFKVKWVPRRRSTIKYFPFKLRLFVANIKICRFVHCNMFLTRLSLKLIKIRSRFVIRCVSTITIIHGKPFVLHCSWICVQDLISLWDEFLLQNIRVLPTYNLNICLNENVIHLFYVRHIQFCMMWIGWNLHIRYNNVHR